MNGCCEHHTRTCEPPSELCCNGCPEAAHDFLGYSLGLHADGSPCVVYDEATARLAADRPPS